jgi:hypothetical protein
MEQSFNNRTSVIYQNPTHPKNYKIVKKRWVLVPMCEYKVSVPYPKPNALNLFQMTILRLLISGSKDDVYIAGKLCLHEELVAFVIDELKRYQLIDERRRVTAKGLELVQTGTESYEIKTGYVYYNYVTKTFMDAFIPDDKHNEVETGSRYDGRIKFDLGTVAKREWKNGIILNVDTSATVTPTPYDVIAICKKHNRRTRNLGFMDEDTDDIKTMAEAEEEKNRGEDMDLPWEIQSVKMLGTQKDVYVATYLFMAADVINRSKLQVCYPFGEGTSANIVECVDKLSHKKENTELKNEILGLKDDVFGMSDAELDAVRKGHSDAEKMIKRILSDKVDDYPAVRDALLSVESSYLLVKELLEANKGSNKDIIKKNLDDYIVNNYNLLASILTYTAKEYDYFTDAQLANHVEQNAVLLKELSRKQGFAVADGRDADKFFRVKSRTVKEAANASQQQLNALFAYNLIVADHFPEHPFYKLAKNVPELVPYLSRLRDLRNDSAHPNEMPQEFKWVSSYRKKNMYIAFLLLNGLQFNDDGEEEQDGNSGSKEKLVKAMRDAELSCESIYTEYFQRSGNIANQLRNLQFENLLKGENYPNRASEVFEAIFKEILSRRLVLDGVKEVKDSSKPEQREELLKEMQGFGFDVTDTPFYYKDRVLATFRDYTKGTLITLFYAWYYSESIKADGMLKDLSGRCPEFIKLIDEIHNNRGHSGKMDFKDKNLDFTKQHIDNAINSMLDIMFEHGVL